MIDLKSIYAIQNRVMQIGNLSDYEPEVDLDAVAEFCLDLFRYTAEQHRISPEFGNSRELEVKLVTILTHVFYLGWEARAASETERLVSG